MMFSLACCMRAHALENDAVSLAIGHDAAACMKRSSLEASWRSAGGDSLRIAASVQAEDNPVYRADPRSTLSPIHDQSSHTTIGSPSRLFARR